MYFLVKQNGEREPVCFSDLTDSEAEKILDCWDAESLINLYNIIMGVTKNVCQLISDKGDAGELKVLCRIYGIALKVVGDTFGIYGGVREENPNAEM